MLNPSKKTSIVFRGYPPVICDYSEYCRLRNIICNGYKFVKSEDEKWCIKLQNGYRLSGDNRILHAISENLEKYYHIFNYQDKIVLDVGGYMGETAVLFASWGDSNIIVYEPVPENIKWVRFNTDMNQIHAEIHAEGLGEKDNDVEVSYNAIEETFSLLGDGKSKMQVRVKSASDIIFQSHADIAKIDCEGSERYLVTVPDEILRLIPEWIIECHSYLIQEAILQKFSRSGFKILRKERIKRNIYNLSFEIVH